MADETLSSLVGGGIKSVQRGATSFSASDATKAVTISTVDPGKSFVTSSINRPDDGSAGHPGFPGVWLGDSVTLNITGDVNSPVTAFWEVVEYE